MSKYLIMFGSYSCGFVFTERIEYHETHWYGGKSDDHLFQQGVCEVMEMMAIKTGSVCVVQFLATRGCRLPACILCLLIFAEAAVKHLVGGDFTQRFRLTRLSKYRAVCWRAEQKHDTNTNTDLKYPQSSTFGEHNTFHFQVDKPHALTLKDTWYLLCYLFPQREFRMIFMSQKTCTHCPSSSSDWFEPADDLYPVLGCNHSFGV